MEDQSSNSELQTNSELFFLRRPADIVYLINITYEKVEREFVREILSVNDSDLQTIMTKYGWKDVEDGYLYISDQAEEIKTKNITEKIDFENVFSSIIAYK